MSTTIVQFAQELNKSPQELLEMFQRAEIDVSSIDDLIREADKEKLLFYLQNQQHANDDTDHYYQRVAVEDDATEAPESPVEPPIVAAPAAQQKPKLERDHETFEENQIGVTYCSLFGDYLKGATQLTVTDPYIRVFHQQRNFMELLELVARLKDRDVEVAVHLITVHDESRNEQQIENFEKMQASAQTAGINFTWEFDEGGSIHARHITTDHGWKILLDRGLDIFQRYEMNDTFNLANRMQQLRGCKRFEITYLRDD